MEGNAARCKCKPSTQNRDETCLLAVCAIKHRRLDQQQHQHPELVRIKALALTQKISILCGSGNRRTETKTLGQRMILQCKMQQLFFQISPHCRNACVPQPTRRWHMTCRITIVHFEAAAWECATQAALAEHVAQHHATALHDLALRWSSQVGPAQATFQAYQDLLTQRCQQTGPLATCSIDRRCLRRFRSNMLGHQVGTAICFVCARRFPFVAGFPNQQISWLRAYEPRTGLFFDHVPETLEALLGMSTYHARYVTTLPADTQPGLQSELAQWTCAIACAPYNMSLLACPEDKRCIQRCPSNRLCTHCDIPMCTSCRTRIYRQKMKPLEALSNDLFLGHPPRELYAQECTMLELLCASPCMTALTCFSIEWRYLQDRSLAQDALMNRHRLCAKGNATTFPLPLGRPVSRIRASGNRGHRRFREYAAARW